MGQASTPRRSVREIILDFLSEGPYAVVGASQDRSKYGNKVLRSYLQNDRSAYPVNPRADTVEGHKAYASLRDLPEVPRGISVITPPSVTEEVVREAIEVGVRFVWMQPGAESAAAVAAAEEAGLDVIADGSCVLVVQGFRD